MLIFGKKQRFPLFLRNRHGNNFLLQPPSAKGFRCALLAPQREGILVLARNMKLFGYDFARLRHSIHAILCLHQRIDEPPAHRRVFQLHGPRIRAIGFAHDERSARHALDAAGDHQLRFTAPNRSRCGRYGIHARTAKPVHGRTGNFLRQTGQQQRHPRDVSIVFSRLVRAPVNHIIDGAPIHTRVSLHQGADRNRRQIIGANGRKRSAIPSDRRSNAVADVCSFHGYPSNSLYFYYLIRKARRLLNRWPGNPPRDVGLLIAKSFNGIEASRARGRIEPRDQAYHHRKSDCAERQPPRNIGNFHAWQVLPVQVDRRSQVNAFPINQPSATPKIPPKNSIAPASAKNRLRTSLSVAPSAFRMPISRRRSRMAITSVLMMPSDATVSARLPNNPRNKSKTVNTRRRLLVASNREKVENPNCLMAASTCGTSFGERTRTVSAM